MAGNNKVLIKKFVVGITICSIIALIFLFKMWYEISKDNKTIFFNTYYNVDFETRMANSYSDEMRRLLISDNYELLSKKLDTSYISKNNLNKSNAKQFLLERELIGKNPVITTTSVYSNINDVYIYKIEYRINGNHKIVNLIETKPYEYTISFEQKYIPSLSKEETTYRSAELKFEVKALETTMDSVQYNVKITNISDKDVSINFNDINTSFLVMDGMDYVRSAASVAAETSHELPPNSYINQVLYFSIPSVNQGKIKGMLFKNIMIDSESKDVKFEF